MSEEGESRAAFSQRSAEIGVAAVFFLLGAIVVFDSVRLGAKWGSDGPEAGYFPFYIALLVCGASLANLVGVFLDKKSKSKTFVEVGQLKLVMSVLLPSIVYVALIGWTGIYVASALFVAVFMRWLGKYSWWMVATVSAGNSVAFFLIFEIWFKVPLPKGLLEKSLGLD